jgi:hypothetical protein
MPLFSRLAPCLFALLLISNAAAQVTVRHPEGSLHGFLVLRSDSGEILATGDLNQTVKSGRVTAHTSFHFKDGSLQEETAIYTQQHVFRLISAHLVQKGPSFPHPVDMLIDAVNGNVTIHQGSGDSKAEVKTEKFKAAPDLANGMLALLVKNIEPGGETSLSMLLATPKPRLVKLKISSVGEDQFTVAGASHKARHFVAKIELGGVAGAVAPLIGKEPPDLNFWIYDGGVPAFLRSQGPLFADGPIWTIELASPVWPDSKGTPKDGKP